MNTVLRRKIDDFLVKWKADADRKPLIIRGARQVGKTFSVRKFSAVYKNFVEINFITEPKYRHIFAQGYSVDSVIREISLMNPGFVFKENDTLIFFDELQVCPDCATCLKFFAEDGRFDVVCSGSMLGLNYSDITSVSVGYKQDIEMHSLDFEEFLWAKGYSDGQIDEMYQHLVDCRPFSSVEFEIWMENFHQYMILGGMPDVVRMFVLQKNFSGTLQRQREILRDYSEDITKYAIGLDKGKVKAVYDNIPYFLAKENKKYQISKIARGARNREYTGVIDWLKDAGVINVCYMLAEPSLPLKGNYVPTSYKIYYKDTGLLTASLDEEAQEDLRANRNYNTYKGALYENIVADMLVKQSYDLYYYRNEKSTLEIDFFVRDAHSLIPLEVKSNDGSAISLNRLVDSDKYPDVKYGIKLCANNIGRNSKFITLPYFCTFLLKKFLVDNTIFK